jgi:hypothetical protein
MIWTVISFNHTTEQVECDLVESAMDMYKAYADINNKTSNLIMSIIKGSHKTGAYIPDIDLTLTRAKYNKKV